jgi:hypothetical protein
VTGMDIDGVLFAGRKIKPVALGLSVILAAISVYNLLDIGLFGTLILGDVVAVASAVTVAALIAGWWFRSQRMAEAGLMLAFIVYALRTLFVLLTNPAIEGVPIGAGICIIAAGSYILERASSRRDAEWAARRGEV